MATEYTVRVHFISGDERIVSAVHFHNVGEEGERSATALVDGRAVPIYNRPEWDFLWYEQERREGTALPEWAQQPTLSECPFLWIYKIELKMTRPAAGQPAPLFSIAWQFFIYTSD